MKGVNDSSFIGEICGSERVVDELAVDVVFQIVQLLSRISDVMQHHGKHVVELCEVGLCEVKHREALIHLLFRQVLQHRIAPMEVVADIFRIFLLNSNKCYAVAAQLFMKLGKRVLFFPVLA